MTLTASDERGESKPADQFVDTACWPTFTRLRTSADPHLLLSARNLFREKEVESLSAYAAVCD
jgi:hypothetical protein